MSPFQRILHVIEPSLPGVGATGLRLLSDVVQRMPECRHDVLILGSRSAEGMARACGLNGAEVVQPPQGLPALGWRHVSRAVSGAARAGQPFTALHAWSLRTVITATIAAPRMPRVATLLHLPCQGLVEDWGWVALRRHPACVLCATPGVAERVRRSGIDDRHVRIAPPGVSAVNDVLTPRGDVRARWLAEFGASPAAFVIGLPAEPASAVDAHLLANAAARVHLSGRECFLVTHHAAARRIYARRFLRRLSLSSRLLVDDLMVEPWRVAMGLDAAFVSAAAQSPLPALWAVAAQVPIIAERGGLIGWDHGRTALLIPQADINAAADRMTRLRDDRSLGPALTEAANAGISSLFDLRAHVAAVRDAYAQARRVGESEPLAVRSTMV